MKTVKISSFLKERKIKLKPQAANCSGLQRIEKIDFSGKIYLSPVQTNTDMILVKSGDLVISGINVEKGALAIYTGEEDVLASIHYSAYEFDAEKIDIDYLKWFLKSNIFRKLLLKQTGSGIKKEIKAKHLLPIEIQLSSLKQQHEIVQQIQGVANYIEEVNRQIQQQAKYAEMLRQSILQQAVEGKLCEQDPNDEPASVLLEKIKAEKERLIAEKKIKKQKPLPLISEEEKPFVLPKGWEWCRLGELANIATGSTPAKNKVEYYMHGTIPWITSSETGQEYVSSARYYVTDLAVKECNLTINQPHTLVMAMYGQGKTRGQITELAIPATTNQACATISCYMSSLNPYLKIYCKKIYQEIRELASGGAQPNLNLNKIKEYVVPCPPLLEQHRISDKVKIFMQLCDQLEEELINANLHSSQLMEAVLQEAFSIQKVDKSAQVIGFHPDRMTPKTELLAAARGKIREDTWEHLCKRALEIAGEES